ncbi:hypothetical protein RDI58_004240 [Solanum bulbocastanum]|uniref:Uncharacterized protein n=1 Tax=Solanum bulbocastanum TaxID=147425 RepID=A0AAN8YJY5_SOLBU
MNLSRGSKLQSMKKKLIGESRGLIDDEEGSEEDLNYTTLQPIQESQLEFHVVSSSYISAAEEDDGDPRLKPIIISIEAYLTRLRRRQNPQEPIGSKIISLRGDKFDVSEPKNLPITPTDLTWKEKKCNYYKPSA